MDHRGQQEGEPHHGASDGQQGPAVELLGDGDVHQRSHHQDDPVDDGPEQGIGGCGVTGLPDDLGDVVEDGVSALELLEGGHADPRDHQVAVLRVEQGGPRRLLGGLFLDLGRLLDVGDLGVDVLGPADVAEHLARLGDEPPADQVAGRLGKVQHAEEEDERRHRGQGEHQAPAPLLRQVLEQEVDDVGDEHPGDDHGLVDARQAAAQPGRRHLRHVGGYQCGGGAHRESEDDAGADEEGEPVVGRDSRQERADHEDQCGDEDHPAPPESIGQLAGQGSAEDGAEHHRGGRRTGCEAVRRHARPVDLEEGKCPGHDADVVTEEDPAEGPEEVDEFAGDLLVRSGSHKHSRGRQPH